MTNPSAPPDPALWTWTDTFGRAFLGPDYAVANTAQGSQRLEGGLLIANDFAQAVDVGSVHGFETKISLSPERWRSADLSVQYDVGITAVSLTGNLPWTPRMGVRVLGQSKNLTWDGWRLFWGTAQLASTTAPTYTVGTLIRNRLTVDLGARRIQILRGDVGVVDVALPDDWQTEIAEADAGTVQLVAGVSGVGSSNVGWERYILAFDNLAVRSGNGSADLGTGTPNSSGGLRLGGEWRFAQGAPDNLVGSDGDVWMDTATGTLYQRSGGAYQPAGQLLAPAGPPGDEGPEGPVGPAGPPADGALASNPILLAGATPAGGLILEVTSERGGLGGYVLLGQHGPACTVEVSANAGATWQAVTYPHALASGLLRLTRTDASTAATTIRALAPLAEGEIPAPAPEPYSTAADAEGYQTISNADATTDAAGYQTLPDGTATTDSDGYQTVQRS